MMKRKLKLKKMNFIKVTKRTQQCMKHSGLSLMNQRQTSKNCLKDRHRRNTNKQAKYLKINEI